MRRMLALAVLSTLLCGWVAPASTTKGRKLQDQNSHQFWPIRAAESSQQGSFGGPKSSSLRPGDKTSTILPKKSSGHGNFNVVTVGSLHGLLNVGKLAGSNVSDSNTPPIGKGMTKSNSRISLVEHDALSPAEIQRLQNLRLSSGAASREDLPIVHFHSPDYSLNVHANKSIGAGGFGSVHIAEPLKLELESADIAELEEQHLQNGHNVGRDVVDTDSDTESQYDLGQMTSNDSSDSVVKALYATRSLATPGQQSPIGMHYLQGGLQTAGEKAGDSTESFNSLFEATRAAAYDAETKDPMLLQMDEMDELDSAAFVRRKLSTIYSADHRESDTVGSVLDRDSLQHLQSLLIRNSVEQEGYYDLAGEGKFGVQDTAPLYMEDFTLPEVVEVSEGSEDDQGSETNKANNMLDLDTDIQLQLVPLMHFEGEQQENGAVEVCKIKTLNSNSPLLCSTSSKGSSRDSCLDYEMCNCGRSKTGTPAMIRHGSKQNLSASFDAPSSSNVDASAVGLCSAGTFKGRVALKCIVLKKGTHHKRSALTELELMSQINHPNIVALRNAFVEKDRIFIAMDLAVHGSLEKRVDARFAVLGRSTKPCFSEEEIKKYALPLLEATAYLHEHYIVHRDIKTPNMLLDANDNVLLCDFGLATTLDRRGRCVDGRRVVGSTSYIAPEVAGRRVSDERLDLFSIGVTLYELAIGYPPVYQNSKAHLNWVSNLRGADQFLELADRTVQLSDEFRELLKIMLNPRPGGRKSARWLINHVFFNPQGHTNKYVPRQADVNEEVTQLTRSSRSFDIVGNALKASKSGESAVRASPLTNSTPSSAANSFYIKSSSSGKQLSKLPSSHRASPATTYTQVAIGGLGTEKKPDVKSKDSSTAPAALEKQTRSIEIRPDGTIADRPAETTVVTKSDPKGCCTVS